MTSPAGDRRSISADSLARLLGRLHADAGEAAHEYERLRRRLVKFFDWRGVWPADECADDVIDRLAHKLESTTVQDVGKYAYAIARLVALERARKPAFAPIDEHAYAAVAAPPPEPDDQSHLRDCFDRCLAELPEDGRRLILRYYEGEQSAKIANRRRLATFLGLTDNALRSRAQRLRERLERCVQTCAAHPVSQMP